MNGSQKAFVFGVIVGVVAYHFWCMMQSQKATSHAG